MKKEELMIGDLVEFGGEPLKVQYIYNNGFDDVIADRVVEYIDYDNGPYEQTEDIQLEYCSPILLTEDILKANGFEYSEKESYCGRKFYFVPNNESLGHRGFGLEKYEDHYLITDHCLMPIKYIHELQQALRLCGLSELANNFVIEEGKEKQQMTIEERAKTFARGTIPSNNSYADLKLGYTVGATEQDCISREDERERCIKTFCKTCYFNKSDGCSGGGNCDHLRRLRKAIEKGDQDEKDNV